MDGTKKIEVISNLDEEDVYTTQSPGGKTSERTQAIGTRLKILNTKS